MSRWEGRVGNPLPKGTAVLAVYKAVQRRQLQASGFVAHLHTLEFPCWRDVSLVHGLSSLKAFVIVKESHGRIDSDHLYMYTTA